MDLDAEVCYCFHVSRRKLENFVRRTKPQVPSRLSECGGAGTGCGWCIPFLKRLFRATSEEIAEAMEHWRRSYLNTPHGKPVAFSREWDEPPEHEGEGHDDHHLHDHGHHSDHAEFRTHRPVAISPPVAVKRT